MSKVTCCHPDNPPEEVTCGRGASCAGQCSALGASLCPSGKCTDDPITCDLEFPSKDDVEEEIGGSIATISPLDLDVEEESVGSIETLSPLDLAWCDNANHQCRVRKHKECCYNPKCLKWNGRKEACSWLNYLTGNSIRFLEISSLSRFLQIFIIRICTAPIFICRNICENSSWNSCVSQTSVRIFAEIIASSKVHIFANIIAKIFIKKLRMFHKSWGTLQKELWHCKYGQGCKCLQRCNYGRHQKKYPDCKLFV